MKKKQIDAILVKQAQRRKKVFLLICITVVIFIICFSFLLIFIQRNKNYYVKYNESNNTKFIVNLKENDFFENNYLNENNEYISSLVDNIKTDFIYKLSLEDENISYKYNYRIEANVNIKRKNSGINLYNKNEVLLDTIEKNTTDKEFTIFESLTIDYNHYNNLMKKFLSVYSLEDVESMLSIKMFIKVIGSCENFQENSEKESVISINIPLTKNVFSIETSDDLIKNQNNLIQCKKAYDVVYIFLLLSILFGVLGVCVIIYTVRYSIKTQTAENIYEKELKKILNNFGSYIQTLNSDFNFKNSQMLIIHEFNDMLEISDKIGQPILLKENDTKTSAYFVIPSNTNILYVHRLKVSDIEKEMNNEIEE